MQHLFKDYYYAIIPYSRYKAIYKEHELQVFPYRIDEFKTKLQNTPETKQQKTLANKLKNLYRLSIVISTQNGDVVGWTNGKQIDKETFKMSNSAILPAHQNKGIYSAVLKVVLKLIENKGFKKIISRHHIANNAILVPKLKQGFIITHFEICEIGTIITLSYYFNFVQKRLIEFKSGQKPLPLELL